ncbi:MAG: energy transducer TonB [Terracidiphilus sp.]
MFEDSTFESTGRIRTRSRNWMVATFTLNGSIVLALILIPLIYPEALSRQALTYLLEAPTTQVTPEPAPRRTAHAFHGESEVQGSRIVAPTAIPILITMLHDREGQAPNEGVINMDQGPGVPNGAADIFRGRRPATVVSAAKGPARVSSGVMSGLLIDKTLPVYPPIAKAAGMQGTVVLQATISKSGTIENLRVISGPEMLQQAALDAVKTWRYRPYLLNGQPVEVETTVNVVFTMGR